jgi:hypothetical protein
MAKKEILHNNNYIKASIEPIINNQLITVT